MAWIVATPFSTIDDEEWIPRYVGAQLNFQYVPAHYTHGRSRKNASLGEWLDYLRHAARAWRQLRRGSHTGLLVCFPQLAFTAALLKIVLLRSDTPIVAWCFNLGRTYGGWRGWLARIVMRQIDVFVVHSRREITIYADWLRINPERFLFVPLSVLARSPESEEDKVAPFLLAMGSANRDYGTLVAAVTDLGIPTIIVAADHATQNLKLPEFVSTRSNIDLSECHALCERARINVVALQDTEAASGQVTVLETMMLGKSLIATRNAGTEDYVRDGQNGILVPPGDVGALKLAIRRLWDDPEARRELGASARRYVVENTTFAAVAGKMEDILVGLPHHR